MSILPYTYRGKAHSEFIISTLNKGLIVITLYASDDHNFQTNVNRSFSSRESCLSYLLCRKDVNILNQLARGSNMSREEEDKAIPVIYVFCTMFRHALFCIYDTDFYSSNAGMFYR